MQVQAVVTRSDAKGVFVKTKTPEGGCGRCHEPGGCRSGMLGQIFGSSSCREYQVSDEFASQVGDEVVVEVPEGAPVRAALLAYFFPLLCFFLTAVLVFQFTRSEPLSALGAVAGLLAAIGAIGVLRRVGWLNRMKPRVVASTSTIKSP